MLMVICGAGASYDANPAAPYRPPLAKELFSTREDIVDALGRWPAATSIVGRMRAIGPEGGAIEDELGAFIRRARETNDPYYRRDILALRFYLKDVVETTAQAASNAASGATSYQRLVTRLHDLQLASKMPVFFVTFNYDTLLEAAITQRFGYSFHLLDDYPSAIMPVFKPHGSVNWVERIPKLRNASPEPLAYLHPDQISRAHDVNLFGERTGIEMADDYKAFMSHNSNEFTIPAIAAPASDKDLFVFPDDHLAALIQLLPKVTSILIIGWRATEAEFQRLCAQHLRPSQMIRSHVITFGQTLDAANEVISNFTPHLNDRTIRDIRGFDESMNNWARDGLELLF